MAPLDFYAAQIMHHHDLQLSIEEREKIRADVDEAADFIRIHLEQAHTQAKKLQNETLKNEALEIVEAALYATHGKSSFLRILDGVIASLNKYDSEDQEKLKELKIFVEKAIVWARAIDALQERIWKDY